MPIRIILMTLFVLVLSGCGVSISIVTPNAGTPQGSVPQGSVPQGSTNGFPNLLAKPAPKEITFNGCPPKGDGSDADLNQRKNRVDDASQYFPVSFATLVTLPYPDAIARKQRLSWSSGDASAIAKYEGVPVSVQAYLADAKVEGPESPNCHSTDDVDFHIWIVGSPNDDKTNALVVEMTPRVRQNHSGWLSSKLIRLAKSNPQVRVSGWVMMDQEHPEQLGKTRGTLWEIHPIMQFEVQQGGQWVALDNVR